VVEKKAEVVTVEQGSQGGNSALVGSPGPGDLQNPLRILGDIYNWTLGSYLLLSPKSSEKSDR
jgi:hypothetical protein